MAKSNLAVIADADLQKSLGKKVMKANDPAKQFKKQAKLVKQSKKLVKQIENLLSQLQVSAEKFRLLK